MDTVQHLPDRVKQVMSVLGSLDTARQGECSRLGAGIGADVGRQRNSGLVARHIPHFGRPQTWKCGATSHASASTALALARNAGPLRPR